MEYFIYRNHTIEPFFNNLNIEFSGYEDISFVDKSIDKYIWCYLPNYKVNEELIAKEIDSYAGMLHILLHKIDKSKMFIVFTMRRIYKVDYQTIDDSVEKAIESYNNQLKILALENPNLKIVDIGGFYDSYSKTDLLDWRFYYISQMPWNPKLSKPFKKWFTRQIEVLEFKRKKCLVLDLDNTLWNGIIGEDGIDGIKIGGDYPGNSFLFFQQSLLELSKNGIILTVCSKNNEEDVFEVWEKHPNIILRKNHFVNIKINWRNKVDNIQDIANELNLGLDSFVFIDDSPTERELVRQLLPSVSVPDFPDHPYLFPVFIKNLIADYFKSYQLINEDIVKTQQYNENALRTQLEVSFTNFDEYLRSLEIKIQIETLNNLNIARLAQLTQKTNQFNLTTYRYTEANLLSIHEDNGLIFGMRVQDKFGDYGRTGLIIIKFEGGDAIIDTFLQSCRILGKNIEKVFIEYILLQIKNLNVENVTAKYIISAKNKQVENLYDKCKFSLINETDVDKEYKLKMENFNYLSSNIYKLHGKL